MLSCLSLSSSQVQGFVDLTLHRYSSLHPPSVRSYDGLDALLVPTEPIDLIPPSNHVDDLIDDPFSPIEPDGSELFEAVINPFSTVHAKYLSIQGSVISDLWMEHMGTQAQVFSISEIDDDVPLFSHAQDVPSLVISDDDESSVSTTSVGETASPLAPLYDCLCYKGS